MKPNLSATLEDVDAVRYPVLGSPKLDGIRCLIQDGKAYSRNMKLIPNASVQAALKGISQPLDGELIVGDPKAPDVYRKTNSGVMSHEGEPNWTFWVFDVVIEDMPFSERLSLAKEWCQAKGHKRIRVVPHMLLGSAAKLLQFESQHLIAGYEGIMGRCPNGLYKYGRSTLREGSLWKLKRFKDGEARIVGFEEQMHNGNEATRDELGRTKRSSHKAGKSGKSTLGALKVVDLDTGVDFDIGTGFSDAERMEVWADRDGWLGRTVKYKYLPVGVKDRPRHPVYLGERKDL